MRPQYQLLFRQLFQDLLQPSAGEHHKAIAHGRHSVEEQCQSAQQVQQPKNIHRIYLFFPGWGAGAVPSGEPRNAVCIPVFSMDTLPFLRKTQIVVCVKSM